MNTGRACLLEWVHAGDALEGGVSGDAIAFADFTDGALLAVLDGLGHGVEAAHAAHEAVRVLEADPGKPIVALVEQCHQALRKTRGAVMSLASFDSRTSSMTWAGVGNVEGILLRADRSRESLAQRGGVIGYQLPSLRASTLSVLPGDMLILTTDGIRDSFVESLEATGRLQEMADLILADYRRKNDDALVVVAKYLGIR
ncbi:MAG TPA: SpoIIE family protein phosphatase [Anaeromyxobacteraceae bacterium]|nr:SpoIIE family protein phosphatase [Anaeromyxobacteraceae bacterium]